MSNSYNYNTPAEGTLDWHIPLNENFSAIESDVQELANELGVSGVGGYNTPAEGSLDWDNPLNENFSAIESDVQTLANELGISGVGGYNTPAEGTLDWHVPLNNNFESIMDDLSTVSDNIGGDQLSKMSTLSVADVYLSLVNDLDDRSQAVYDATTFDGSSLAHQVENAMSAMGSEIDGRAVLEVPAGTYSWDKTVEIDTGSVLGPMLCFANDAAIDVTADWAFNVRRSGDGSNYYGLTNDPRNQVQVYGGKWTLQGTGWMSAVDIYRGLIAPVVIRGGTHGLLVRDGQDFSEGWSVRDVTFEGVSEPIRFNCQSGDQQLLANLTFRDFQTGVFLDQASGQNLTASNLVFESPRSDAVGLRFNKYTTGTVYGAVWTGSTGALLWNDGNYTRPSVVDADIADGGSLWKGLEPDASSDVPWQQCQDSPVVVDGGPQITAPVVRTDSYSGSLADQIEAAAGDLSDGGTILISGQDSYDIGRTISLTLGGRDISVVSAWNVRFNVTTSGWTFDVTGDGYFGIFGGFWHGQNDGSKPGWLTTDVPNLDVAVNAVWFFPGGSGINATPRSKGSYRIFDTRFHKICETNEVDLASNACVQIGGSGCAELLLSHIETSETKRCYRFNAAVDDFHGVRLSAHPWSENDGAKFAETNASLTGTWFNVKWEAPRNSNSIVFDNSNTSSPADAVEPWSWADGEPVELWRGTKPQFFPGIDTRVDTAHIP
ncbi:hypothetical protein [Haloarcula sp. CBA1127]|uniref:hypothetical protein n=1 Tax=Haloarcula sp. CBA1127 TaxID=1765055 RepID=UPI00073E8049|nr:hypothetical protein [Haloarcula sp. CBA1127]